MASGQVVSVNPMGQTTAPVQPPSAALVQLLSPDGYYTYLNVQRATEGVELDEEQIKKNYRKLSLKHHPDRPTGDAHCFRVLNRAQKVLLHPKLRQQYDLLGIDLEEDDEDKPDNEEEGDTIPASEPSSSSSSSAESIISHMASATLATILQVIVRTVMMGLTTVVLVRYRLTLFPAVGFLIFVAYRVHSVSSAASPTTNSMDMLSPLMIGVGLVLMYRGRSVGQEWSYSFWVGEALVLTMFSFNSLPTRAPAHGMLLSVLSFILTFWSAGKVWRYAVILALEALVAILCALAFPIMELILEQILADKLRKVGDKIRQQNERIQAYYASQLSSS